VTLFLYYEVTKMYKIEKILSNNVIMARDEHDDRLILVGPGVGFHSKAKTKFMREDLVEQIFILKDQENKTNFERLLKKSDPRLAGMIAEQLMKGQIDNGWVLNENIHVSLLDHLSFAIERQKNGLDFEHPFNAEINLLYPKEYTVAERIITAVRSLYSIELCQGEIGITAIHIQAAHMSEHVSVTRRKTAVIQAIIDHILESFHLSSDSTSFGYQRLLLHCKYAVHRIYEGKYITNDLLSHIIELYPEDYEKLHSTLSTIARQFDIELPDAEVGYLLLHAKRIKED